MHESRLGDPEQFATVLLAQEQSARNPVGVGIAQKDDGPATCEQRGDLTAVGEQSHPGRVAACRSPSQARLRYVDENDVCGQVGRSGRGRGPHSRAARTLRGRNRPQLSLHPQPGALQPRPGS